MRDLTRESRKQDCKLSADRCTIPSRVIINVIGARSCTHASSLCASVAVASDGVLARATVSLPSPTWEVPCCARSQTDAQLLLRRGREPLCVLASHVRPALLVAVVRRALLAADAAVVPPFMMYEPPVVHQGRGRRENAAAFRARVRYAMVNLVHVHLERPGV